jgi:hypothetical protein
MRAGMLTLAGISAVLAGIIVIELRPGTPGESTAQAVLPGRTSAPAGPAVGDGVPEEWIATALARPLFSPTRRPPAQTTARVSGPVGLPRLTGVMTGPFGQRAIFAGPDGGKPLVVETGDNVGDYRVQGIENGLVTLNGPDGTRRLRPSFTAAVTDAEGPAANLPPGTALGLPPGVLPEDIKPDAPAGRRP